MTGKISKITHRTFTNKKGEQQDAWNLVIEKPDGSKRLYSCFQRACNNFKEGDTIPNFIETKTGEWIDAEGETRENWKLVIPQDETKKPYMSKSIQEVKSIELQVCLKCATDLGVALINQGFIKSGNEAEDFVAIAYRNFKELMPNGHADEKQQ